MDLKTLTAISWRNLLRNKRRTLITASAIVCNTAILILMVTLMEGFTQSSHRNITHVLVGDVQLHAPGFTDDRSIYKSLTKHRRVLQKASSLGIGAAPRSLGIGLVSMGEKSAGGSFIGVDPKAEKHAFELYKKIAKGKYLSKNSHGEVILGARVAKSLNAKVGGELIAVVQAADGSMGNDLFRVAGVFKSVGENLDRDSIIVHKNDFDSLFMNDGRIHQIAFNSHGKLNPEQVIEQLQDDSSGVWQSWITILPATADALNMNEGAFVIFGILFSLAAAMGTMNTMLMATHDRVREFGLIRALGASPKLIIRDVAYEASLLGLVSTIVGGVVGVVGAYYLQEVGIDLSAYASGNLDLAGISMDMVWKASLTTPVVFKSMGLVWSICVLTSLYPAIKSSRLNPALAMKHV